MEIEFEEIVAKMLRVHHAILRELIKEMKLDTDEKIQWKKEMEELDVLLKLIRELKRG